MKRVVIFLVGVLVIAGCSTGGSEPRGGLQAGTRPPADGQEVQLENGSSFRLISDVEWDTSKVDGLAEALVDGKSVGVIAQVLGVRDGDLKGLARDREQRENVGGDIPVKLMPDRTVNGRTGFVIEGKGDGQYFYEFGAFATAETVTTIRFYVPDDLDPDEWIEPILSSVEWSS